MGVAGALDVPLARNSSVPDATVGTGRYPATVSVRGREDSGSMPASVINSVSM